MPYEYRKLSPKEREEIVNYRQVHGYPLHAPPHPFRGAGVIGRKKYFYALWGDMVNTASRMESHSESGKIQITRATYELVRDEFACDYVGEITVKGKGKLEAWYLIAKKEDKQQERSLSHV